MKEISSTEIDRARLSAPFTGQSPYETAKDHCVVYCLPNSVWNLRHKKRVAVILTAMRVCTLYLRVCLC